MKMGGGVKKLGLPSWGVPVILWSNLGSPYLGKLSDQVPVFESADSGLLQELNGDFCKAIPECCWPLLKPQKSPHVQGVQTYSPPKIDSPYSIYLRGTIRTCLLGLLTLIVVLGQEAFMRQGAAIPSKP